MSIFTLIKWLYFAVNAYLIIRLSLALRGAGKIRVFRVLACLGAFLLSIAYPVSRMVEGNGFFARALTFSGTFWLSLVLHVLLLLIVLGLFRFCNRRFSWLVIPPSCLPRWRIGACGGIVGAALLISGLGWVNTQRPTVREITLPTPSGTAPLKIVALSDTHLGRLVSPADFSRLIDLAEPFQPDLVLFAGDILDDYYGLDVAATRASLKRLNPPLGVWGVLGNHEYIAGDPETSRQLLEQSCIRILRDDWANLDGKLLLVGRDDRSRERFEGQPRKPLAEILAGIPAPLNAQTKILLDHQPFHLEDAQNADVFLQLSGHTHKGQLFPFNFVVALLYENAYGHSQRGQTHYWVSSGAGTWGPRSRTTGRPEILLIRLVPET
ncbi:MAG: metallophosphoesterase [Zoogloeaceae bacterium]|jgi:predicted MPP superfamily phosphohydrolase|nr:metallophosphoesterase [Zoogloeaceae bacterium]